VSIAGTDRAKVNGSGIAADTISELTAANGVAIDSVTLKDGGITAAGTINFAGATISDLGTVTTADIDGGTIDGTTQASGTINGPIAAGGTWTAAAAWPHPALTLGGTVTSNGQSFSGTIADLGTVTTADINGGTIDGATIGGSTPAAATVTTFTSTGIDDNASTTELTINASGKLSINTTDEPSYLQARMWGGLSIEENDAWRASLYLSGYDDTAGAAGQVYFGKSRGSEGSETVVQNGDAIGYFIDAYAWDGANYEQAALAVIEVDGVPAGDATDMPGRIAFYTTPDGSDVATEKLRITNAGDVRIGTTSDSSTIQNASSGSGMVITSTGVLSQTNPGIAMYINRNTSTGVNIQFKSDGSSTGNISSNLTTTSYNATSDVRLKENIRLIGSQQANINGTALSRKSWLM
jgi:hypothetical protein